MSPFPAASDRSDPDPLVVDCPIAALLELLAGKWALPILYRLVLLDRPARFGVLQRQLGRITQKELASHLRQFEALGLVDREAFAEMPPRVEYRITALGRSLQAPLDGLAQWSLAHRAALERSRRQAGLVPAQPRGETASAAHAAAEPPAAEEPGNDEAAAGHALVTAAATSAPAAPAG
jgi:DNA-binding HxlR family transcriptional regulator